MNSLEDIFSQRQQISEPTENVKYRNKYIDQQLGTPSAPSAAVFRPISAVFLFFLALA